MNAFKELTASAITKLNNLQALIMARRANAERIHSYLLANGHTLNPTRRMELQRLLDETLASLDVMDADYTMLAGSPCGDNLPQIN